MAQVKKRQHTVPRTLLKGFANPKGMVATRRRDGRGGVKANITDATVENFFYSFIGQKGERRNDVEEWLDAYAEAPITPVLERLRGGHQPAPADLLDLAKFTATGLLRTASTRSYLTQIGAVIQRMLTPRMRTEEYLSEPSRTGLTINTATEADKQMLDAYFTEACELSRTPEAERQEQLRIIIRKIPEYVDRLITWTWSVSTTSEPSFITGDSPVATVDAADDGYHGLMPAESPVMIPLSPTVVLIGEERRLGQPKVTNEFVSLVNQGIATQSYRAIFASLHMP